MREIVGDTLTVKAFSNGSYEEYTAEFVSVLNSYYDYVSAGTSGLNSFVNPSNCNWLLYSISDRSYHPVANPEYITIDLTLPLTVSESSTIRTCLAVANSDSQYNDTISTVYASSRWQYKLDGVSEFAYCPEGDGGVYNYIVRGTGSTAIKYTYCPIDLTLDNSATLVTGRATFYGPTGIYIMIRCFTVSDSAIVEAGDTSGGGSDGGSSVDLTETNGILSTIQGWLSSIAGLITGIPSAVVDGVGELFVPDDDVFTSFASDIQDLLEDKLGLLWSDGGLIQYVVNAAEDAEEKDSITIPAVSINFGSFTWSMGGNTVSLVPSGFSGIIDVLATIIDIIALFAVVNMIKHRVDKEVLGGASE